MLVSHVPSSSRRNGDLPFEVIEEEKIRVRVLGEPDLRRRHVREQRHRHAIVLPAQRLTERAQKLHRSLPAIALDVGHVHRRRPVLQDDDVDAGRAHERGDGLRLGERENRGAGGEHEEEPEQQLAEKRNALFNRHLPSPHERARVAAPAPQLPEPEQEQHHRHGQQR